MMELEVFIFAVFSFLGCDSFSLAESVSMDVLNFEDKGASTGKGMKEEEDEENKKDGKNGDEEVQEEGAGMVN